MAAELGQTSNPKDLIPGEPEIISADLRQLVSTVQGVDGVGSGLSKIDPVQWTGGASDAFRTAFGAEPPKWQHAVEDLGKGGEKLADFGDTLVWSQKEAQRAIEQFHKAQAATRAASAHYDSQVHAAQAGGQTLGDIPGFQDPGKAAAREAQAILDNARAQLKAQGDAVAAVFGFTDDKGNSVYKGGLGGLDKKFGGEKGKDEQTGEWQSKYGRRPTAKAGYGKPGSRTEGGEFLSDKVGITGPEKELVGTGTAHAELLHGKADGGFGDKNAGGSGSAEGSLLGADAEAKVTAGPAGVTAAANAEAYLAKGSADGELHAGPVKAQGHVEAVVGATGAAHAHVGPTGADVGGEAFAGAKAKGDASASVGGVGAGVHGEAWAGVGASANAQAGMGTDGKFHIGASAGVALGVGGKVGFDVAIDPKEVTDTAKDVANDVGDVAKDVGHGVENGAKGVAHAFGF